MAAWAGVGTVVVRLEAGADDLAQLLHRRTGASVRRVAILFELNRQSAAAFAIDVQTQLGGAVEGGGTGQAVPLEHRTAARIGGREELAVLDEHQRRGN